ncbi:hypothetical protein D3C77_567560 [compost metagenome]
MARPGRLCSTLPRHWLLRRLSSGLPALNSRLSGRAADSARRLVAGAFTTNRRRPWSCWALAACSSASGLSTLALASWNCCLRKRPVLLLSTMASSAPRRPASIGSGMTLDSTGPRSGA